MLSAEYYLDRENDLKAQGKIIVLRRNEDIGTAYLRELENILGHISLASITAYDFEVLRSILNELGYTHGGTFNPEFNDDDIENEVKLAVSSEERFMQIREQLEGKLSLKVRERNYVIDKGTELKDCGRLLRLRKETLSFPDESLRVLLTYKGPNESSEFKRKLELETRLSSCSMAEQFFKGLGFTVSERYWKEREVYDVEGVKVFLDRAHGFSLMMPPHIQWRRFVEIEGSDEEIKGTMDKLGLNDLKVEQKSYYEIL